MSGGTPEDKDPMKEFNDGLAEAAKTFPRSNRTPVNYPKPGITSSDVGNFLMEVGKKLTQTNENGKEK